ncbi:UDP-N-acetylmuramate--L-alanine ligase [Candidatus Dependentiae bacterium]|nr:UDP-N-acetylmuramate--L-alanine ligase [Candidatus Dependentiae bacterium]
MFGRFRNFHFIGIGGVGMCGIAEVLLNLGFKVTGSDIKSSDYTKRLEKQGAKIFTGHKAENISGADVIIWSSAVSQSNPELLSAKEKKIPVIRRAEMLAELMRLKIGVAIAGTHGKTTTTSIVSLILANAGFDPTIVIGGKLNNIGSGAKLGKGNYLVAEADESDGSFLKLFPQYSIVTNIDSDHLDHYGTLDILKNTFLTFIEKLPFYGLCAVCIDDMNIRDILPKISVRHTTYGLSKDAEFSIKNYKSDGLSSKFDVVFKNKNIGNIKLVVPGMHNVLNSLAAIAVTLELGIDFKIIADTLAEFRGVQRRFQIKSDANDMLIVDDYGHHPTEIAATLSAARSNWKRRIIAVFQPHRYTRTQLLAEEFGKSFKDADIIIVTDIYAASEEPIPGVSSELIINSIKKNGNNTVIYKKTFDEIIDFTFSILKPGDIVLTLGAGNIWAVSEKLSKKIMSSKNS